MIVNRIDFKVKGTTFENEEKVNIQDGIIKILNEYKRNEYFSKEDLYGGWSNKEIKENDLNVSEYEGIHFEGELKIEKFNNNDCVKIYIDTYTGKQFHIGYAPKEKVEEIVENMNNDDIDSYAVAVRVIGGKHKYCVTYEEDYKEKERIETKYLTYGFEVEIVFHNSNIEEKIDGDKREENKEVESKKYSYEIKQYNQTNKVVDNVDIALWIFTIIIFAPIIWVFFKFFSWLWNL